MKPREITDPSELEAAWSKQYDRLSRVFAGILRNKSRNIVEIGCGRGQLTIPLAMRLRKAQFVLVDRFVGGTYSRDNNALGRSLRATGLTKRTEVTVSDHVKWFSRQSDNTHDAVVSSEFLPELNSAETRQFVLECYRILKPKGVTVHSFLSPVASNSRQRLLITADSNPLWTRTPPKEWFSPKPEFVIRKLRGSGFRQIRKIGLEAPLVMKAEAAKHWLKSAEVRPSFYKKHKAQLNRTGLELPDWIIVAGLK